MTILSFTSNLRGSNTETKDLIKEVTQRRSFAKSVRPGRGQLLQIYAVQEQTRPLTITKEFAHKHTQITGRKLGEPFHRRFRLRIDQFAYGKGRIGTIFETGFFESWVVPVLEWSEAVEFAEGIPLVYDNHRNIQSALRDLFAMHDMHNLADP